VPRGKRDGSLRPYSRISRPEQLLFLPSRSSIGPPLGLVVRVLDYRSGGPGSIAGTTRKKKSGSGTRSTQPREYN
jgi:hypothetical protein